MTPQVIIADPKQHAPQIRELFREYLQWANERVNEEFKVSFDIAAILEGDMQNLGKYMPPDGRLFLDFAGNDLAGIACLKQLTPSIGEIKRMYVRPDYRKLGIGRALVKRLLQEAEDIGYRRIRLDSARFMKEAHQLYRSAGFKEITAYEGSEIPREFDESRIYHRVKREYAHRFINHSKEEYSVNGISTNTIEGFWSQMKRSIDGTYHCVSPKYLQLYVNEFVFRYNVRQDAVYPHLLAKAGLRVQ